MKIEAASLALTGIRHAFFTRDGGVSGGLYASLNGGIGSRDAAGKVAENRARMAAALGVEPHRFLTAYQIHSPNVVVAEAPWTAETRPHADAIVTRMRALAIGVTTADCGPILLADPQARRDRRRACRLARRAHRRHRGDGRGDGTARRRTRPNPRRDRSDDPAIQLRGRPRPDRALCRRRPRQQPLLLAGVARRPCPVRSWRLCRGAAGAGRRRPRSRISACAPMPIRPGSSAIAAPRTAPRPTTAGTSTPSHWSTDAPPHCSRRRGNSLGLQRKNLRGKAAIHIASPRSGLYQDLAFVRA